ncbi:MAG: amidohydrolase [Rhodospirillaceae bacterium]|nr:amidohydrolase [Rhodospirillaceae bacterium]
MPAKSDNHDWLARHQEATLEPGLPICDAHHHLWTYRENRGSLRYGLEEYAEDLNSGHNIVSTVFIQCGAEYREGGPKEMRPVGETEFIAGVAAESASGRHGPTRVASAIIGFADLRLGAAIGDVLDAHVDAGTGLFRGVRCGATYDDSDIIGNSSWGAPEHLLLDPGYRDGAKELDRRGLIFEGWCYHTQMAEMIGLARALPDLSIVVDHAGGPLGDGPYAGRRAEILEDWKASMAELAACENVVVKLGGLNMKANGFAWEKRPDPPTGEELLEAARPYFEFLIERFGIERCMFESNFPVDKQSCGYNELWNSYKRLATNYSAGDKAALFHDTATRVYRVEA